LSQSQRRAEALQPAPPSFGHRSRAITPLPSTDQRTALRMGQSALPKYTSGGRLSQSQRRAQALKPAPPSSNHRSRAITPLPSPDQRTADETSALPKYASGGRLSQSQRRAEALQPAPPSSDDRSRAITPLPSPGQHTADETIRPPKIRLGRAIVPIAAAGRGASASKLKANPAKIADFETLRVNMQWHCHK
jgi:hypothetical protein